MKLYDNNSQKILICPDFPEISSDFHEFFSRFVWNVSFEFFFNNPKTEVFYFNVFGPVMTATSHRHTRNKSEL